MKIEQIYTGCLAQGAYYIESDGEAAIIDPLRETEPYLERVRDDKATIKYIFETHFHADFVSGHIDLARKSGATIVYGPTAKTEYQVHVAQDGEIFNLGKIKIKALHTPGHTLESTTYLLFDESGKEHAIFSGDTLFIGDVGRPDLAVKSNLSQEDLAGLLFDSLREKIMPLSNEVIVYPAHGAGSACGKNMSKETWDTLGNQKIVNYALRSEMTKSEFIKEVTTGIAPPPQYFAKNAIMNKTGYAAIEEVLTTGSTPLNSEAFEEIVNKENALVLDTRSAEEFAAAHIPNSIFIGIDGNFAPWVGALITDLKQAIVFIAPSGREEEVVLRLSRVGYDHTMGFLQGGIDAWIKDGKEVAGINSISAEEFSEKLAQEKLDILDVRKPAEYLSEHLPDAMNMPLDYINTRMSDLKRNKEYYLHCAGGYRSMIFASILQARGFDKLVNINGGFAAIKKAGAAVTDYVCPSTITE
jgi:rhodanese-related sulfurtransferase/glyoxylase-like metal-dependent hydrolase (beta-lactamase superfamily II)